MSSSTYPGRWQLATDERLRNIVRLGTVAARAVSTYSVHVEVRGLLPGGPQERWLADGSATGRAHGGRPRPLGLRRARGLHCPGLSRGGSEFVCPSITSGGDGYDEPTGQHPWAAYNPNCGSGPTCAVNVNTRITPDSPTVDYLCVPQVGVKGAAAFTRATFVVDDAVRGLRQTYDNPGRLRSALAPRSDAQKIRDTLEAGSH